MKWLAALVCMLASCGRFGFGGASTFGDAASDSNDGAAGGDATDGPTADAFVCTGGSLHDEDGDSIRDSCDVCPHIPDPSQPDGDGDRVGDMCDPEPTMARQQIVLFDPFVSLDAAWMNSGGTITADQLVLDARGATSRQVERSFTPANDRFIIGATTGTADAGTHHMSFGWRPSAGGGNAYCEMFDTGVTTRTQFTWTFDDVNYNSAGVMTWPSARLANGSGTFSFEVTATTAACSSTWQGVTTNTGNAGRPAIAAQRVFIYSEDLLTQVSYFIQIRTN